MPAIAAPVTSEVHDALRRRRIDQPVGERVPQRALVLGLEAAVGQERMRADHDDVGIAPQRMRERIDHRDGKAFLRHGRNLAV